MSVVREEVFHGADLSEGFELFPIFFFFAIISVLVLSWQSFEVPELPIGVELVDLL